MDFMKVIDQTVREIKREVNLKVLKVPEIEQKVLDATSDEPWGPHGYDLADIARATKRYGECAMIMNVLWQRLGNTGANWRHVYKALAVIEYLLANGTERVVDEIIDNSSQIAKLTSFEYVEPNGKDVGLNVRKKAENVLATVDDRDKLQQIREKAAATRDKYFGLSSTGITYKSSAASGNGSYSSGSHYGSTQSSKEADTSSNSYRGKEWSNQSKETISNFRSTRQMSRKNTNSATNYNKPIKGERRHRRNQDPPTSHLKSASNLHFISGGTISQKANKDDDDDFNPRGPSTSVGRANVSSNHMDLFGPSLMDDLVDTTASTSRALPRAGTASVPEVDLFANADFHSATPATGSHAQDIIDLFAGRSSFADSINSDTEFSGCGSNKSSEHNPSCLAHSLASVFDPFQPSFATSFPSDTGFSARDTPGSGLNEPRHDPPVSVKSSDHSPLEELNFGAFTSHTELPKATAIKSLNKSPTKPEPASMSASKTDVKKGAFQVKSGIWADSLSRGLIDLNITAPKKVHHSDIGIVGQMSNGSEEKASAAPWYMGATMLDGSGLGSSGFALSTGTNGGGGAEISSVSSLETSIDFTSRSSTLP
ncbi:clathrin interactor EPSIN 1-like isoform X3 [Miscanthus floridulus]|uniref:clathrin interactor EPSIN 1-like isoform X3 n=1 Tax=Miscanthus floridulus TaxID=154761 RepID=UPI00345815F7